MHRLATAVGIALLILAGCRHESGVVYQNSTIDALLDGNYDGEVTLAEVRRHGQWGLGTLQNLDGEMIVIGGAFYQIRADGKVRQVPMDELTPFAAVTDISHSKPIPIQSSENYAALQKSLDSLRRVDGHAYAFVIEGTFAAVRTRSVPRQSQPYPPLSSAVANQRVFELSNVPGTMVGFWFPPSMQHVNVPGYHFHFLTSDRSSGGHVLDVTTAQVTVRIQQISEVRIALPRTPPTEAELNHVER